MDDAPRPTDRWLPFLGIALIAEAFGGAFLRIPDPFPFHAITIVAAVMGVLMVLRTIRPERDPSSWAAVGFAAFALAVVMIVNGYQFFVLSKYRAPLSYLSLPATMLMGSGGSLFWGAALARRDDPGHEGLAKIGRIGAGIAQLGFVFIFVQEVPSWGRFGSGMTAGSASTLAMWSLVRIVLRVLLLWASIEMM